VCALFCKEFLFLLGLGKLTKLVFTKKKGKKEKQDRKKERKKERRGQIDFGTCGGPQ
jgi:hypothetical protein